MRRLSMIAAAWLGGVAPLQAQQMAEPRPLKPKACSAADSLLAPNLEFEKARVLRSDLGGSGVLLLTQATRPEPKGTKVNGINVMLKYEGAAAVEPAITLQLNLVDTIVRNGAGTKLTLALDGATPRVIGFAEATPWRGWKLGRVPQGLSIALSSEDSRALALARQATGSIGETRFELTAEQLGAVRGVLVVAACGQAR
jgi:hypothetical protein